jgi:hypothetical protein
VAGREVDLDNNIGVHRHAWTLLVLLAACQSDIGDVDGAFFSWDARRVHCAVDIDSSAHNDMASIESGLDRAAERGEVVELYAHHPGVTIAWHTIETVLAGAQQRGLAFYTYADLAHGAAHGPGILLSFDDEWVDEWWQGRSLFDQYGARLTFFIAYYPRFTDDEKAKLHDLANDGHAIEAHTITHARAPSYVEAKGLRAYLDDEVVPSIDLLRADGYDVTTFAYPFGARTGETDHAILEHVPQIRSVAFTYTGIDESPCPH